MEESRYPKKQSTAFKRKIQSDKARSLNKLRISRIKSTVKSIKKGIEKGEKVSEQTVAVINSLSDKAVKRGCIKLNKASRIKSWIARLAGKS